MGLGRIVSTIFLLFTIGGALQAAAGPLTLNVMGPLTIGDVHHPDAEDSALAWEAFRSDLKRMKILGAEAVSTDIWWGLVEPADGQFHWRYYDKVVTEIENAGLKWVPILSFHRLGGNVGDVGEIAIPEWIWSKYVGQPGVPDADALKFRSEQGRTSSEYVSVWGTRWVIEDYRRFMREFQNHFRSKSGLITEINIGLGPAGELRYPSYNGHDEGSGYGTRGSIQAYSSLAIDAFREFVRSKYGTIESVNAAWGFQLADFSQVMPPNHDHLNSNFFHTNQHFTPYGKDFFDFYNQSLIDHGRQVLEAARGIFAAEDAPFRGLDLGSKIPGVHWGMAHGRIAELSAGLIRTSLADWQSANDAFGYRDLFKMLASVLPAGHASRLVLHFTALELLDGHEGEVIGSKARTLNGWIGQSAAQEGLIVKGENAVGELMDQPVRWDNVLESIDLHGFSGFTALRMALIVASPAARHGFAALSREFEHRNCTNLLLKR